MLRTGPTTIIDTGPLVAYLYSGDRHGAWVEQRLGELRAPLVTCEPVLTEALFLLDRQRQGHQRLFQLLSSGVLEVNFSVMAEQRALASLMQKYRDLPMSLADACLVRMAELTANPVVFTLDTHFRTYRRNGRQAIPLILPES